METEWFTLKEAHLQVRPFQQPRFPIVVAGGASPAGATLAGKYADGLLTFGANLVNPRTTDYRRRGLTDLWDLAEKSAKENHRTISREGWRFAAPIHLAETKEQAFADVRHGAGRWVTEYLGGTLGQPVPEGVDVDEILDVMVEEGRWIVGTPDDCADVIENLFEASGGYGTLLAINLDWTTTEKVKQSYELLARYVMPRFQVGANAPAVSQELVSARREELLAYFNGSITRAEEHYKAQAEAKAAGA